jgi:hypothetical protein
MFKELKEKGIKPDSPEWNQWFFKYSPGAKDEPSEEKPARKTRAKYEYKLAPSKRNRTQRKRRTFTLFGRRKSSNRNSFF